MKAVSHPQKTFFFEGGRDNFVGLACESVVEDKDPQKYMESSVV
jgi:hypothetical protein